MPAKLSSALVWFRRDLRVEDHAALFHACRQANRVWCVFVFDTSILDPLQRDDRRVAFIHAAVEELDRSLRALAERHGVPGAGLIVRHGVAAVEVPALAARLGVQAVYLNRDDDPVALRRDAIGRGALANLGIAQHESKDHVIFERSELLTGGGSPYGVFTPYSRSWLAKLDDFYLSAYGVERHAAALAPLPEPDRGGVPALTTLGFKSGSWDPAVLPGGTSGGRALLADFLPRLDRYDAQRDYPALKGPSYLGAHLRFGTLSIRELARLAHQRAEAGSSGARVWRSELAWRDFYHQILHHHPRVVDHAYKPDFDRVAWAHGRAADAHFAAWCKGRTGYPLVDAAMLQLLHSGYMHNRLRMVSASFLTKDLGIDWRRGEAWFARHLLDYDLAANNGGWQWAASTGCDAQPWFRIFNPVTQSRRFDPQGRFIRRYLPQLAALTDNDIHAPWLARPVDLAAAQVVVGRDYPAPVVDHDQARRNTLARFAAIQNPKAS
ncbi:MAG: cryptochrome/photolyase family protein [Aquabacterium sp.]